MLRNDLGLYDLLDTPYDEPISAEDISGLAEASLEAARKAQVKLGTVESCTGGLVSAALTSIAGSSDVVWGGITSYAIAVKEQLLEVSSETLTAYGAVSEECVCEMASGARRVLGCDCAVAISGIAGPGGAVPGKPVGTVCFCVDYAGKASSYTCHFSGNRDEVRAKSVGFALRLFILALEESV